MAEALELMLTGMCTVVFILIMVVFLGNLIIRFTNKLAPIPVTHTADSDTAVSEISPAKLAAIITAVDITTKGKGKVSSIEKVKN